MIYWCVAPFNKPRYLNNLLENYKRQSLSNKCLCIVENGSAIDACKKAGIHPDIILQSEEHQSIAKNKAIEKLQSIDPTGVFVTWDCDDYYGSEYLSELNENINRAKAVGKLRGFVNLTDGLYRFNYDHKPGFCKYLHGATLNFKLSNAILFPKTLGEEGAFCEEIKSVWAMSPYHYIYNRIGTDNTFVANDQMFRAVTGDAHYIGQVDYDIVNKKEPYKKKIMKAPEVFDCFDDEFKL